MPGPRSTVPNFGLPQYGKTRQGRDMLIYDSKLFPGYCYQFARSKETKRFVYWRCMECTKLHEKNKDSACTIPSIEVSLLTGCMTSDPDNPTHPHYCVPIAKSESTTTQLVIKVLDEAAKTGKRCNDAVKEAIEKVAEELGMGNDEATHEQIRSLLPHNRNMWKLLSRRQPPNVPRPSLVEFESTIDSVLSSMNTNAGGELGESFLLQHPAGMDGHQQPGHSGGQLDGLGGVEDADARARIQSVADNFVNQVLGSQANPEMSDPSCAVPTSVNLSSVGLHPGGGGAVDGMQHYVKSHLPSTSSCGVPGVMPNFYGGGQVGSFVSPTGLGGHPHFHYPGALSSFSPTHQGSLNVPVSSNAMDHYHPQLDFYAGHPSSTSGLAPHIVSPQHSSIFSDPFLSGMGRAVSQQGPGIPPVEATSLSNTSHNMLTSPGSTSANSQTERSSGTSIEASGPPKDGPAWALQPRGAAFSTSASGGGSCKPIHNSKSNLTPEEAQAFRDKITTAAANTLLSIPKPKTPPPELVASIENPRPVKKRPSVTSACANRDRFSAASSIPPIINRKFTTTTATGGSRRPVRRSTLRKPLYDATSADGCGTCGMSLAAVDSLLQNWFGYLINRFEEHDKTVTKLLNLVVENQTSGVGGGFGMVGACGGIDIDEFYDEDLDGVKLGGCEDSDGGEGSASVKDKDYVPESCGEDGDLCRTQHSGDSMAEMLSTAEESPVKLPTGEIRNTPKRKSVPVKVVNGPIVAGIEVEKEGGAACSGRDDGGTEADEKEDLVETAESTAMGAGSKESESTAQVVFTEVEEMVPGCSRNGAPSEAADQSTTPAEPQVEPRRSRRNKFPITYSSKKRKFTDVTNNEDFDLDRFLKNRIQCAVCAQSLPIRPHLAVRHIKCHFRNKLKVCRHCGWAHQDLQALSDHLRVKHGL